MTPGLAGRQPISSNHPRAGRRGWRDYRPMEVTPMKVPKKIGDLSKTISESITRIREIDSDIRRAEAASQEASNLAAQLDDLSRERAERKALAFVAKTTADVADLNRREEELERASRQAIEDGQAATLAIGMLADRRANLEAEIERCIQERKALSIEWLQQQRHEALTRYIKVLTELGGPLAAAMAADRALSVFGVYEGITAGMLQRLRSSGFAIPHSYKIPRYNNDNDIYDAPIPWLRDDTLGDDDAKALIDELRKAGVEMATAQ